MARLREQGLTGQGIKIRDLDTGVDGRHPALKQAIGALRFSNLRWRNAAGRIRHLLQLRPLRPRYDRSPIASNSEWNPVKRNRLLHVLCLPAMTAASLSLHPIRVQNAERQLPGPLTSWFAEYETALAMVVADERLEQRFSSRVRSIPSQSQVLYSTYSFVQLLDDDLWLGIREVKSIDGIRLPAETPTLVELLQAPTIERARELAWRNARRNFGPPRTTNVPTLPLEFLRPRNRERFLYQKQRAARDGQVHITFTEVQRPTLLRSPDGTVEFLSSGSFWIDASSGVMRRAMIEARPANSDRTEWSLEVKLRQDRSIDLFVPYEANERFLTADGNGQGRARYSNFKKFGTTAKIRPF